LQAGPVGLIGEEGVAGELVQPPECTKAGNQRLKRDDHPIHALLDEDDEHDVGHKPDRKRIEQGQQDYGPLLPEQLGD